MESERQTRCLPADRESIRLAGEILRRGGLVGIPTETVYGLAANAFDETAVSHIFQAKDRPADNPLIVHIAGFDEIVPLVREVPPLARRLAAAFWPGPLTLVLPKAKQVPRLVSAGLDTVAVRLPAHPVAQAVIRAAGVPLAAPSANRSGAPSPTTAQHVMADLAGRIDLVLDAGPCEVGVESTVLSLAGAVPRLLRPGKITPQMLRAITGELLIDEAVLQPLAQDALAVSPGMKYKHYAPRARVVLLEGSLPAYENYVNENAGDGVVALCYEEEVPALQVPAVSMGKRENREEQARRLFDALRQVDQMGAQLVYAHYVPAEDQTLAVCNRLLRAAGFEVISLA